MAQQFLTPFKPLEALSSLASFLHRGHVKRQRWKDEVDLQCCLRSAGFMMLMSCVQAHMFAGLGRITCVNDQRWVKDSLHSFCRVKRSFCFRSPEDIYRSVHTRCHKNAELHHLKQVFFIMFDNFSKKKHQSCNSLIS